MWRLSVQVKGKTRVDVERALNRVVLRLKDGDLSGADSTEIEAYLFVLQETE